MVVITQINLYTLVDLVGCRVEIQYKYSWYKGTLSDVICHNGDLYVYIDDLMMIGGDDEETPVEIDHPSPEGWIVNSNDGVSCLTTDGIGTYMLKSHDIQLAIIYSN